MPTRTPPRIAPRLGFVRLEDRLAPATFVVTTTLDNGSDLAPTAGSLRAAIVQANIAAGADTIAFNIPGGGVQTIDLKAQLPALTDTVTLDGTTQPGYAGTPVVRLSGTNAGPNATGLRLLNHTGTEVRAVTIGGFGGAGVAVQGGGQHKLRLSLIGTSQNGSAADANGTGVIVASAQGVLVGGTTSDGKNVISGNKGDGVVVRDGASGTIVSGNFLGTDLAGVNAVPNGGSGVAVLAGAVSALVGGLGGGAGNLIAGNAGNGVRVADPATAGTMVFGNRIGLNLGGSPLPNGGDGVRVDTAAATAPAGGVNLPGTATVVRSNTLKANTGFGVSVRDTARYVTIDMNGIGGNAAGGILVDPTANAGTVAPILTGITGGVGTQTLTGRLTGPASSKFTVTVYSSSNTNSAGAAQGENQLGTATATTDAGGTATFSFTVPADASGGFLTATATGPQGDTSTFSNTLNRSTSISPGRTVAVGTGSGAPQVQVYASTGQLLSNRTVLDAAATGGVRVASADFNGDNVLDQVVGTGPGAVTQVRVIDGNSGAELFRTQPFEAAFTGGVFVAAGDITGDGKADVIVSPDQGGGPRIDVYSGAGFANGTKAASFFAFQDDPNFRGGARAAVGDVNGDGRADLVVSAGFGGGPRIATFDGKSVAAGSTNPGRLFGDFFAFENTLRNGAFVAAGDINADGKADLIFGGGPGGGPRVLALNGASALANQQVPLANFFAGDTNLRGGVRVAARDLDGDGKADLIAGDGPGGAGNVRLYDATGLLGTAGPTPRLVIPTFTGSADGVFVG